MAESIFYVDSSEVREGKGAELRSSIRQLVEFIETHEPQLIHYGIYLSEDDRRMAVVAVHPDAASLEYHMDVGGPVFRGFAGLITMQSIDVYGPASDALVRKLRQKAEMLGGGAVRIHQRSAGFERFVSR